MMKVSYKLKKVNVIKDILKILDKNMEEIEIYNP